MKNFILDRFSFGLFFTCPRTRSIKLIRVTRFIVRLGRIINSTIVPRKENRMGFFFKEKLVLFIRIYTETKQIG